MDQNPGQPVSPALKTTPKDVFLELLSTVTLYATVISFIALCWQFINLWFPDPFDYRNSLVNTIRWAAAMLVVMYPVYLYINSLIQKGIALDPIRRELWVHKWLTYLTLFVSAITLIIDVVVLVYNLLGGEMTPRFILKVLVVLLTAAAVFLYYRYELTRNLASNTARLLTWGVSILVLAAVVGGFIAVGSPAKQRARNFDQQRVADLQTIQSQVIDFWRQKQQLPQNLNQLKNDISGFQAPTDPKTKEPYKYTVNSNLSFTLCAQFQLKSDKNASSIRPVYEYGVSMDNFLHEMGETCFSRTIDPDLVKPMTPNFDKPMSGMME